MGLPPVVVDRIAAIPIAKRLRLWFFGVALAAALSSVGCSKETPDAAWTPPNVFLVVMDACSAGFLGCYGDPSGASPNVDRFAAESVVFENAYSQSASTVPSTASLMTGVRPTTHRLSGNSRLSANWQTLAELLRDAGFATHGFIANPYAGAPQIGLDRGYLQCEQVYAAPELQEGRPLEENAQFRVVWPDDINQEVFAALEGMKPSRHFAYVHYLQPHKPYSPPARFADAFDPDRLGKCDCGGVPWNKLYEHFFEANRTGQVSPAIREHITASYRANIQFVDEAFGALLARLKKAGLYDNSLIILTADHGEAFFKHQRFGHNNHLYDDMVRIPMVMKFPAADRVQPGRIPIPVQTIDVLPTVLACARVQAPAYVEGASLRPLAVGASDQLEREGVVLSTLDLRKHAIRRGNYKYIYSSEDVQELFNLRVDPDEQNNVLHKETQAAEALRRSLEEVIDLTTGSAQQNPSGLRRDPRMDRLLNGLGYTEGKAPAPTREQDE